MIFDVSSQNVVLTVSDIYDVVKKETSHNFRAFRSVSAQQGAEVNTLYQDMVINDADEDSLDIQLDVLIPEIYQDIRAYTDSYSVTSSQITFSIKLKDENAGTRLKPLFEKVIQNKLLAWWYKMRNPQLAQQYTESASNTMSAIRSIVIPTFGVRRLRQI